jgi:DNA-binding SARP family transcriptional activator
VILKAVAQTASVKTAEVLSSVDGADVAEMRREFTQRFADHIYIRSIGAIGIHRGGWFGPSLGIGRKRIRLLLGLLARHFDGGLTRDMVLDFLWPDASPSAAVNSLNQTVFQLRRLIDREYREGESPQYVLSNLETVQLNTEIVSVDLAVVRDLARQLPRSTSYSDRREIVARLLDFVRGEYMADLKYEEWVSRAQFSVHAELREILMPIAAGEVTGLDRTSAIRAGAALVSLDPFDEMAHLSVARHMAESGQRTEGREVLIRLAARLRDELDESPSDDVRIAAAALGADLG